MDNSTAFHLACTQGSLEIVQLLVGADPDLCKEEILDEQGMVPLHRAALNNHESVVSYLVDEVGRVFCLYLTDGLQTSQYFDVGQKHACSQSKGQG